ncbi:MAG: transcription factor FapR [Halanaerobiales bacterium]|nr:transcription factor FapR [Halanaerobiales bacterium]
MSERKLSKKERHEALLSTIENDPFKTDQELANLFAVSIQTIRLDRMELRIPEVRKRARDLAKEAYSKVKSIPKEDMIGELIEVNLNQNGKSVLVPGLEMAFQEGGVTRGHYIFAQANSLAIAIVDSNIALTGLSHIKYLKPVHTGDRLVAKAHVVRSKNHRFLIRVYTYICDELVFKGKFIIFAMDNHKLIQNHEN